MSPPISYCWSKNYLEFISASTSNEILSVQHSAGEITCLRKSSHFIVLGSITGILQVYILDDSQQQDSQKYPFRLLTQWTTEPRVKTIVISDSENKLLWCVTFILLGKDYPTETNQLKGVVMTHLRYTSWTFLPT